MLTVYDGENITYDGIGNPITYRNGISFTWKNGRRLASFSNTEYNITYKYNDSGQRTSKIINGAETKYLVTGEGVLQERRPNGDILTYMRDLSGSVVAFEYYSAEDNLISFYYLLRNVQGDVIAITDRQGNKLVEYTYDAWGKVLSVTGSAANTIGQLNPYRYRGYYYDVETGFYYLQSRYYDPEVCRFLNADGYVSTGQGIIGNNMFSYCNNCPIVFADYDGYDAIYVADFREYTGLWGVGHARVFIEIGGNWSYTEFTGESKLDASVIFEDNFSDPAMISELRSMKNGKKIEGVQYTYIAGDFTNSMDVINKYVGTNYGGYCFFTNNCLDYAQEVLNAGIYDNQFVDFIAGSDMTAPFAFNIKLKSSYALSNGYSKVKKTVKNGWDFISRKAKNLYDKFF